MDEIITTPKPTEPPAPVRGTADTDAEWQQKERDYAPLRMSYDSANAKWTNANKKCMAVIKNTIEPNILSSIGECDTTAEYLEKIKNQFTGSSKTYATQIIEWSRYYKGSYHGDERLELQAKTNGLGSQGRVFCSPSVCFAAKGVCTICCKLQHTAKKVEHEKGNWNVCTRGR